MRAMAAPRILGVPSAAYRVALLRETTGGGRVPVFDPTPPKRHPEGSLAAWEAGWSCEPRPDTRRLILHDDADPEDGEMGLARLARVAGGLLGLGHGVSWCAYQIPGSGWTVELRDAVGRGSWRSDLGPSLRDATSAAHAIAIVCVHLGLLDRVELLPRLGLDAPDGSA